MGNLFSSSKNKSEPQSINTIHELDDPSSNFEKDVREERRIHFNNAYLLGNHELERANVRRNYWKIQNGDLRRESNYPLSRTTLYIKEASKNFEFLNQCLATIHRNKSEFDWSYNSNYQTELWENSPEYLKVLRKFPKQFEIVEIQKIDNPFLMLQYEFKKLEYQKKYLGFTENIFHHGTTERNSEQIGRKNFDWRLNGTFKGHKFGQGVSFSISPYYASHYGDVIILTKVLVNTCCRGNPTMKIPPEKYDTSVNQDRKVFVKYEDDSFCPRYIIKYNLNN